MSFLNRIRNCFKPAAPVERRAPLLSSDKLDALRGRIANEIRAWKQRKPIAVYEDAKAEVFGVLLTKEEKEKYLIEKMKCPNCGATEFDVHKGNAATTFLCDCRLRFNLWPQLRKAEIVYDPRAV